MSTSKKTLTGSEIFFEALKKEKVEYIFGYPGGATLKLYEQLYDVDFLQHILCRHEQGATHMA
ncbi:MAG: thiamine pyrophosphate-binding protein, partial [Melioribacteraceae bacterium]|nr:thiamine pyrophosphate-binding protein [Melioribacteraceae bacterium]